MDENLGRGHVYEEGSQVAARFQLATMGKKKGSRREDDDPFADLGEDVSQNNWNPVNQETEETPSLEESAPGYVP